MYEENCRLHSLRAAVGSHLMRRSCSHMPGLLRTQLEGCKPSANVCNPCSGDQDSQRCKEDRT